MIIKKKDATSKITKIMNIKAYKISSEFSGALIEINGNHGTIKSLKEDRVYFIIGDPDLLFFLKPSKHLVDKPWALIAPRPEQGWKSDNVMFFAIDGGQTFPRIF